MFKILVIGYLYSIRSEIQLCEQIGYNMLFRWFLDMQPSEKVWTPEAFSMNRQRFAEHGLVQTFFDRVVREAIDKPATEFGGPTDVFEKTLAHEQYITGRIHKLYALATEEKDYASTGLLQWFVDEQVEEESSATEILEILKLIGDKGQALFMMDRQLGSRE